ncbi:MAG TPA: S9 family peptidase [Solimonas sp.]
MARWVGCFGLLQLAALSLHASPPAAIAPTAVKDFIRFDEFSEVRLSPRGDYIAVGALKEDETNLAILRLSDMTVTGGIRSGPGRHVSNFWWVGDNRVVATYAEKEGGLDTQVLTGELLGIDADGRNLTYLYGYKGPGARIRPGTTEFAYASMVRPRLKEPGHALIASNSFHDLQRNEQYTNLLRIDIASGRTRPVARAPLPGWSSFLADRDGNPRYVVATDSKTLELRTFVRDVGTEQWRPLKPSVPKTKILPYSLSDDGLWAYFAEQAPGARYCLVRQDLQSEERQVLSCDAERDLSRVLFAADGHTPIGAYYGAGQPRVHWIEPEHADARLLRSLEASFPGQVVLPESWSADGNRLVFRVSSDRDPAAYYLLDRATRKASLLLSSREWNRPERMGAREAYTYRGRDGATALHAVLTHPVGAGARPLPLIVNVHGGPFGVYDRWFWDGEAQLFASRGYRVLQPNFRGSGGYGAVYENAARQGWGTMMIDDIIDATRDLVARGLADPDRICIYGGSYGAYAALMSAVREPDLFRCVIGYAGVYDLIGLKNDSDIRQSESGRNYIQMYIGGSDAHLRSQSPIEMLDRLKAPVFIVHGKVDMRAPFSQARNLRKALDKRAHPYEWLEKSKEGHGFNNLDNRQELYERVLHFVDQHIGAGAGAAASGR